MPVINDLRMSDTPMRIALPPPVPPRTFFPHFMSPGVIPALLRRNVIRDLKGLPPVLGRMGALEIRLATTKKDIRRAQKLRWRVFFEQGHAKPDAKSQIRRRDICSFDRVCDHLIVIDHDAVSRFGKKKPRVVGTYRLLRQDVAAASGGFYSATEFDISPLLQRHPGKRFLELGRSCVLPEYRSKRTLELLWRGIWTYVLHHRVDALIGCASLDGDNPLQHALALSFLHHHVSAQDEWMAKPLPGRGVAMNLIGKDAIDNRRAIASLPPLIKGYMRLGAMIGDGAVVDRQFGTTDVFVVMPVERIDTRYIDYFSPAPAPAIAAA
jgi:putative hemolysin